MAKANGETITSHSARVLAQVSPDRFALGLGQVDSQSMGPDPAEHQIIAVVGVIETERVARLVGTHVRIRRLAGGTDDTESASEAKRARIVRGAEAAVGPVERRNEEIEALGALTETASQERRLLVCVRDRAVGTDRGDDCRRPVRVRDLGLAQSDAHERTAVLHVAELADGFGDPPCGPASRVASRPVALLIDDVDAEALFFLALLLNAEPPALGQRGHGRGQIEAGGALAKAVPVDIGKINAVRVARGVDRPLGGQANAEQALGKRMPGSDRRGGHGSEAAESGQAVRKADADGGLANRAVARRQPVEPCTKALVLQHHSGVAKPRGCELDGSPTTQFGVGVGERNVDTAVTGAGDVESGLVSDDGSRRNVAATDAGADAVRIKRLASRVLEAHAQQHFAIRLLGAWVYSVHEAEARGRTRKSPGTDMRAGPRFGIIGSERPFTGGIDLELGLVEPAAQLANGASYGRVATVQCFSVDRRTGHRLLVMVYSPDTHPAHAGIRREGRRCIKKYGVRAAVAMSLEGDRRAGIIGKLGDDEASAPFGELNARSGAPLSVRANQDLARTAGEAHRTTQCPEPHRNAARHLRCSRYRRCHDARGRYRHSNIASEANRTGAMKLDAARENAQPLQEP